MKIVPFRRLCGTHDVSGDAVIVGFVTDHRALPGQGQGEGWASLDGIDRGFGTLFLQCVTGHSSRRRHGRSGPARAVTWRPAPARGAIAERAGRFRRSLSARPG